MGNHRSQPQQQPKSDNNLTPSKVTNSISPELVSTPYPKLSASQQSQHVMALIDPRSPTVEISRTPITVEEEKARREKMLKMMLKVNNSQDLEKTPTNCDDLPAFDPRSPSYNISRTPILLETSEIEDKPADNSFTFNSDKLSVKRELDTAGNGGQLCRELRKRLFISQQLNMSDNELLNSSAIEDEDKEN